jgi:hypothetical protein
MKVLAISQNRSDPTPYLGAEGPRVAELRQAGVLEQFWLKADRTGAVLLLEVADADDARRQLATLPLVENGITSFEVTELLPPPGG